MGRDRGQEVVRRVQGLLGVQGRETRYRIYVWGRTPTISLFLLWRLRAGISPEPIRILLLQVLYQRRMKWMKGLRVIAGRW